jgi:dienelactone hydrolase
MELEAYLHSLTERAEIDRMSRHVTGAEERHRSELVATFRRLLGDFSAQQAEAMEPRLLERVQCEGYTRERVEIATLAGLRMAMYVLVPNHLTTHSAPAVIACHGHGYGSREIVGLEPDGAERSGNPGLHKDFAVALVHEGYVVLAPELIGFGDRRLEEDKVEGPGKSSCFKLAASLLLTGKTLAGLRVYETSRAIDYLQGRNEVDSIRIAIMGISGGGLVASFTAALDDRIRCAVISGYASLFAESILTRNHCLDNYIPGVLLEAEMPELLGLIAPRGLFLESGSEDHLFTRGSAQKAYLELQSRYLAIGELDAVQADFFDGGHEIHGAPAYAWLRKQLMEYRTYEGG